MTAFPAPDGEPELEDLEPAKPKPRRKPAAKPKPRPASSPTSLQGQLRELLEAVGGAISFVNPDDGRVITVQAAPLSEALDRLAKQNPNVRRVLQGLLVGGAWGEVLSILILGIALPIASNHRLLPWQKAIPPRATPTGPEGTGVREPRKPEPADPYSGVVRNAQKEADALLAELGG